MMNEAQILPVDRISWIDIFVGILVAPIRTMRELAVLNSNGLIGLGGAAVAVIIPSILEGLRMSSPQRLGYALLNVPAVVVLGLLLWLCTAGLYSLLGFVFGAPRSSYRGIFVLIAWSFLPWIFMAPIYCYKDALGMAFPLMAAIPVVWTFILEMVAVKEAYGLRPAQMLGFFFVAPVLYQALQLMQLLQGVYVSASSMI